MRRHGFRGAELRETDQQAHRRERRYAGNQVSADQSHADRQASPGTLELGLYALGDFRAGPAIDYKFESAFPAGMAPAPNYMQAMTDTDADKKGVISRPKKIIRLCVTCK